VINANHAVAVTDIAHFASLYNDELVQVISVSTDPLTDQLKLNLPHKFSSASYQFLTYANLEYREDSAAKSRYSFTYFTFLPSQRLLVGMEQGPNDFLLDANAHAHVISSPR